MADWITRDSTPDAKVFFHLTEPDQIGRYLKAHNKALGRTDTAARIIGYWSEKRAGVLVLLFKKVSAGEKVFHCAFFQASATKDRFTELFPWLAKAIAGKAS